MQDQTIRTWLDQLASSTPAPGGGAAAALNAAVGAALVEMVCNLTIGKPRYAEHEATMRAALAEATKLRGLAQQLAADGQIRDQQLGLVGWAAWRAMLGKARAISCTSTVSRDGHGPRTTQPLLVR